MADHLPPEQPKPEVPQSTHAPEKQQPTPIGVQEGTMVGIVQEAIKSEQPDEGLREIADGTTSDKDFAKWLNDAKRPEYEAQQAAIRGREGPPTLKDQINSLGSSLESHYNGAWGYDETEDPVERQAIIDKELEDYSNMTGFPIEDNKKLLNLRGEHARSFGQSDKGAEWVRTHQEDIAEERKLSAARRDAIEQKVTSPSNLK